jgi:hypothetical protein
MTMDSFDLGGALSQAELLVKKVSFSNEFQTLVEHSLHRGEIVGQDDSYYITGHNLVVDGGLRLR